MLVMQCMGLTYMDESKHCLIKKHALWPVFVCIGLAQQCIVYSSKRGTPEHGNVYFHCS